MRSLTVFIPGLFGSGISFPDDFPNVPALNWFLKKGQYKSVKRSSFSYSLCELFDLIYDDCNDLPIASISRLIDSDLYPEGIWVRVDPVYVNTDGNRLKLSDSSQFTLTQHDALEFATRINKLLEIYNITIEVPCPSRWYVKLNEDIELRTTPIDSVVGNDILPFMPKGNNRINIDQLINDIQMTLHDLEINTKREQENKLPINSIWFWGYGKLPSSLERNWSTVFGDEILSEGLSAMSSTPFSKLPEKFEELDNKKSDFTDLIVISEFDRFRNFHNFDEWDEMLVRYEMNWFLPIFDALKRKDIDQIRIETDINSISLDKNSHYKFWRQKKNFIS
ncbi:MAG: hypothetical protein CMF40_03125 [Legionellales bacterium]|nr:hypothetical protein [Legionellales bacterium]